MRDGRPTPREPRDLPGRGMTAFVCLLMVAFLAVVLYLFLRPKDSETPTVSHLGHTHDSLCATYTHDGEAVRWYVFVDPEYGTQWLYNDHDWRAFPRLGEDGRQIGLSGEAGAYE